MASEAAVIREEMNQTRVELDQKLARLEARARELRPRSVARRYLPDYSLVVGAVLTLAGALMAWRYYRNGVTRRARIRTAVASYGSWDSAPQ